MAGRRASIFEGQEVNPKVKHDLEHYQKEKAKAKAVHVLEETRTVKLNGEKVVETYKKSNGNGYSVYLGNIKRNPELKTLLKEKGVIK